MVANSANNKPVSESDNPAGAAAPEVLPLLLSLPDVSWPPARHAERLPRVVLEDVTVIPEITATPTVSPASQVKSRTFTRDRAPSIAELPWHERPAVREWIAKLVSGGIIALVVLTLAGMFARPWRASHKEETTTTQPADTAVDLKPRAEEPLIRQAQREPAPKTVESKPVETFAKQAVPPRPAIAPQFEVNPPKSAPPTIAPSVSPAAPSRLPPIEPELNAPQNGPQLEEPTHYRSAHTPANGLSDQEGGGFERTARLRGIIEPQSSRLR